TTSIRDEEGTLLFASGLSTALEPNGVVHFVREIVPELELRWLEVGCQTFEEDVIGGTTFPALPYRGVAIGVQFPRTRPDVFVAWQGDSVEIPTSDETYVFALSRAAAATEATTCGFASWALYRKGFMIPEE